MVTDWANRGSVLGVIYLLIVIKTQTNDTTQEAHSEIREKWWLKIALKFRSCII
jgi:hypothetical protein